MHVLVAPASLKGALAAAAAASALAEGFRRAGVETEELPIADGGEGTAQVIASARGGDWRSATVADPFGRPVEARWLVLPDGTAVIDSAEAIGLDRVGRRERDPLRASSHGLGELVEAALGEGPVRLVVGLGGSATVDGGAGLRDVLAALPVQTVALCDVQNRLLGRRGAARAFAPQKGASAEEVEELERRLAAMRELEPYAELRGAGAAGGLGAAFALLGAELVSGARYVFELIGFGQAVRRSALVVTGEGLVDASTLEGKAPGEAVRFAREEGVRCAVFGGRVLLRIPGATMYELGGGPARSAGELRRLGERLGREL